MRVVDAASVDDMQTSVASGFVASEWSIGETSLGHVATLYEQSQRLATEKPYRSGPDLDLQCHSFAWRQTLFARMRMKRLFGAP